MLKTLLVRDEITFYNGTLLQTAQTSLSEILFPPEKSVNDEE